MDKKVKLVFFIFKTNAQRLVFGVDITPLFKNGYRIFHQSKFSQRPKNLKVLSSWYTHTHTEYAFIQEKILINGLFQYWKETKPFHFLMHLHKLNVSFWFWDLAKKVELTWNHRSNLGAFFIL